MEAELEGQLERQLAKQRALAEAHQNGDGGLEVVELERALEESRKRLEETDSELRRLQRQLYELQRDVETDKEAVIQQAELSRYHAMESGGNGRDANNAWRRSYVPPSLRGAGTFTS